MNNGLEDVVAAETVLSDVRGAEGQLIIGGYPLVALAGRWTFEQTAHLLFTGFFDDLPDAAEFTARLGAARVNVFEQTRALLGPISKLPTYDGMRAAMAMLPDGTALPDALRLVAAPAVLLPALIRLQAGDEPIEPSSNAGHAADVIRMLGRSDGAEALDTYLVTVSDHGLNASTFAARVVASTQAGLTSSVLAGLGALKGPLHGGAPGPVIDMLDAIAEEGDSVGWIERALNEGERLMGFGHRIYRMRDPRADALKAGLRSFRDVDARLRFAEGVEQVALEALHRRKPDRVLETNVEFYTALLLEAAGFPKHVFTGVFAMGRIAGWLAHAREQALTGRLIRPASRYVGPVTKDAA
ncbi:citrate synthase/methylcitrate synthase [Sphingopyxis lindanitolerans]|uniref:citrate synthase (unknown stereospecificity) n=1 Tax=Sphingopyxis lindanitolerans TaxID=2054227 RepID=A0A2S8B323_9SPHN|nr:citrate synthase/methylcitrate synthase [Sphingopyxis lindanitolerans]PQM26726.1 citrate synthase/methylcitrate synthase [Sphingopyxis lindanitolerans]